MSRFIKEHADLTVSGYEKGFTTMSVMSSMSEDQKADVLRRISGILSGSSERRTNSRNTVETAGSQNDDDDTYASTIGSWIGSWWTSLSGAVSNMSVSKYVDCRRRNRNRENPHTQHRG
eukprot:g3086.t1